MKFSRRDFLKLGCLSVAGLMSAGMLGCSPQQDASYSSSSAEPQAAERTSMSSSASSISGTNGSTAAGTAVVFFSCTGNTEKVAEKIATATDSALMSIEPVEPYTSADLDYNSDCRANTEQNSGSARPAMAEPIPDVAGYDTVYLGYPIWWGKAPRIILTFLESTDLAGKTIVPFCTSGSSPINGSIAEITQAAPSASVLEGKRFSANVSQQEIDSWVNSL